MTLVFIAILLRILSNPVANVFQKRLTQGGIQPLEVNATTYLLLSLFCIVLALPVDWASLPMAFWLWVTVAGIFGAVGNGLLVKALEHGDLSILGPINSYKSVVGMAVGIIMLGEVPSLLGLLVAWPSSSSAVISCSRQQRKAFHGHCSAMPRYAIASMPWCSRPSKRCSSRK